MTKEELRYIILEKTDNTAPNFQLTWTTDKELAKIRAQGGGLAVYHSIVCIPLEQHEAQVRAAVEGALERITDAMSKAYPNVIGEFISYDRDHMAELKAAYEEIELILQQYGGKTT